MSQEKAPTGSGRIDGYAFDPHGLPVGPDWLSRLRLTPCPPEMTAEVAHEIARYIDRLRTTAWEVMRALERVGDDTAWTDGDETDRVYSWGEIRPLKEAILDNRSDRMPEPPERPRLDVRREGL